MSNTTISNIAIEALTPALTDWYEIETVAGLSKKIKHSTLTANLDAQIAALQAEVALLKPAYAQILFDNVLSTTTNSYIDITGFYVTLTPRTELIKISHKVICGVASNASAHIRLVKDSTPIYVGATVANYNADGSCSFYNGSTDSNNNKESSGSFIIACTPNVSTTIKLQIKADTGGTIYVNTLGSNVASQVYSTRCVSSLLVEEYYR